MLERKLQIEVGAYSGIQFECAHVYAFWRVSGRVYSLYILLQKNSIFLSQLFRWLWCYGTIITARGYRRHPLSRIYF